MQVRFPGRCAHTRQRAPVIAKAVTTHCAPCRISAAVPLLRTRATWRGHRHRAVAQPPWGYSFAEQPPGPHHSSRRPDTKQAAPCPTRACPWGAEYLLEAERLSVDHRSAVWPPGRFRLLCSPEPRPPQGLAQAFQRPEGQKWEEQGGNAANGLPNVAVIVSGLLRDSHSVPRGSSLTATGGLSSELSAGLSSDFKGKFQRNIK